MTNLLGYKKLKELNWELAIDLIFIPNITKNSIIHRHFSYKFGIKKNSLRAVNSFLYQNKYFF